MMTKKQAERIKELRCGNPMHSWRALSEVYCEEFAGELEEWEKCMIGNQMHGKGLCEMAIAHLYEGKQINELSEKERNDWGM